MNAATETLTSAELELCRGYVQRTGNEAAASMKSLSAAQWSFKPGPERWSIAEILEHMVVVQELVLGPIREKLEQAPVAGNSNYAEVDALVMNRFPEREVKLTAPEAARPAGRFSPDAGLTRLAANCVRLREYVESTPDLRLRAIEAMPLKAISKGQFEYMDGYQWVLAAAAHTARHTKQIREVQAEAGYPVMQ